MPEISLNLLKEKIIKTDVVIHLLADKNAKIVQLREKLKMLYHKYVNKVKECEVLQLKIDLCKIEHDPLQMNLKELISKYDDLEKEHSILTNSSEIRYQNKCMELESQIKKYNDLIHQKERCTTSEDANVKYDTLFKKHEKINKQLQLLTSKYKEDQQKMKDGQNNIINMENNFSNEIKSIKEKHINEITILENVIALAKLSESKLKEDLLQLNNKLTVFNQESNFYDDMQENCVEEIGQDNCFTENLEIPNIEEREDQELEQVLNILSFEEIPPILSPLSDNSIDLSPNAGNGSIEELSGSTNSDVDATTNRIFQPDNDNDDNDADLFEDSLGDIYFGSEHIPNTPTDSLAGEFIENVVEDLEQVEQVDLNESVTANINPSNLESASKEIDDVSTELQNLVNGKDITTEHQPDKHVYPQNIQSIGSSEHPLVHSKISSSSTNSSVHSFITKPSLENTCRNDDNPNLTIYDDTCSINNALEIRNVNLQVNKSKKLDDLNPKDINGSNIKRDNNNVDLEYNDYLHKLANYRYDRVGYIPKSTCCDDLLGFSTESGIISTVNNSNCPNHPISVDETDEAVENISLHDLVVKESTSSSNIIHISIDNNSDFNPNSSTYVNEIMESNKTTKIIELENRSRCSSLDEECATSSDICETNTIKLKSNKPIVTECKHIFYAYIQMLNKILTNQHESSCYIPSTSEDNLLGFQHSKETKILCKMRPIRKKFALNKMKTELFHALVKYFTRRMGLNRRINMARKDRTNYRSSNFKNVRRLQMLRWKRLRELYLSSTDTDSDNSRRLRRIKTRSRSRNQSVKQLTKDIIKEQLEINEQCSDVSEDELILRQVITEEQNYQNSIANHKELEEFYYKSAESVVSKSCESDKDEINSADSGYVKSDTDEINTSIICKRKRIIASEENSNKKIMLTMYLDNEPCEPINNCAMIDGSIKTTSRKDVDGLNQIRTEQRINESDKNQNAFSKKDATAEICSLLHSDQSNEAIRDDSIKEGFTNSQYLFGSDCESLSSQNEDDDVLYPKPNTRSNTAIRSNTARNIRKGVINLRARPRRNQFGTDIKATINPSVTTDDNQISKSNPRQNKRKVTSKSEQIPEVELESIVEDPLRNRLWQECLSSLIETTRNTDGGRSSFKRSNSLKPRQKILEESMNPVEIKSSEKIPPPIAKKIKILDEDKSRALLKQLLTFPDKIAIIDKLVEAFSTQDNTLISRTILLEASFDTNKADTQYTPPAPVLTEMQRILLGFLVRLNRTSPGLLENFIMETEEYLLTSTMLQSIENITRLYLSVCKLQRMIHRMRRMVCDAFYFMGDLSIPFLFTVLSTWIEVLPLQSEVDDEPIVKVVIEVIKLKKCISPGYNLIPLKSLLKAYYGYNMEESCLDDTFLEIFRKYTENQTRILEYAILLLCKNVTQTWILQRIEQYVKPLAESTTDLLLKENISRIMNIILENHNPGNEKNGFY